jgi:hypothetical protein
MKAESLGATSETVLIRNSLLFQHFSHRQEEILRHKWIESEKAHRDIGYESALVNWIMLHQNNWRRKQKEGRSVDDQLFLQMKERMT